MYIYQYIIDYAYIMYTIMIIAIAIVIIVYYSYMYIYIHTYTHTHIYVCVYIFIYQPYHMPYQWHIYSLNTPSPAAPKPGPGQERGITLSLTDRFKTKVVDEGWPGGPVAGDGWWRIPWTSSWFHPGFFHRFSPWTTKMDVIEARWGLQL